MTNLYNVVEDFDNVPFTISAISYDLKYLSVNTKLAKHFNRNKEDFKNKEIGDFSKNQYFRNLVTKFRDSEELSFAQEIESNYQGTKRNYYILGTKRLECMFFLGIDVSEVKSMEHKLVNQEKMSTLGNNLAGIIHEINSPLNSILFQIEMLDMKFFKKDKAPTREEWDDFKQKFHTKFNFLSGIIKSIQMFSYDSEVSLNKSNARDLIEQSLILLNYKIKKSNVKINLDDFELNLNLNPSRFMQVVINLLNNSFHEIKDHENPWINISLTSDDLNYYINFTDSGNGIPDKIRKRMFEHLFTTKKLGEGTGIGLHLCQKYLNAVNLDLKYEELNNNTNFSIIINKGLT